MALKADGTTLRERLNVNQPNTVADKICTIYLGSILRSIKTHLFNKVPAADPYALATLQVVKLNDYAKALAVLRAYSKAGTVVGELAVQSYGTTPATGQVAVTPSGDIAVLATDAITRLDVAYLPRKYDAAEVVLPVSSNTLTLPTSLTASPRGVMEIFEVEVTKGTSVGNKIILVPGNAAPAAGQARLNAAKATVLFAPADAATEARVKMGIVPAYDLDAMLEATSDMY